MALVLRSAALKKSARDLRGSDRGLTVQVPYRVGMVILMGTLAGCSHAIVKTQALQLGVVPVRPPVSPDKVAIYKDSTQVPGKYEMVAQLLSSGDYSDTDEEMMYASMRKRAGELGANAIILLDVEEPSTSDKIAGKAPFYGGNLADRKGKALAVFVLPKQSP
jgi:hypothetical protein